MTFTVYVDIDQKGLYAYASGVAVNGVAPSYISAPGQGSKRYAVSFAVPHILDAETVNTPVAVEEVKP